MERLNVNPTRMELTKLKKRLVTAVRGHKLLKDKRDELMKQFLDTVRGTLALREKLEKELQDAYGGFFASSALMSPQMMAETFLYPKQGVSIDIDYKNIMSVNVPVYTIKTKTENKGDIFPYGFANTPCELDDSVQRLSNLMDDLLKLAQMEKTVKLLAQEIEKTRRRVNALEYVMIPRFQETIKYIVMKLDENERGNTTRLMKVKDMVLTEAHDYEN